MGFVYIARNKYNQKCYIGKTVGTLKKRIGEHYSDSKNNPKQYFHKAIRKYGEDSFIWEILSESDSDDELYLKEIYFINLHNTTIPNGYNMTIGGEGAKGFLHSEETKSNLSKIHYGKKHSEETKRKIYETRIRRSCICIETGVEYLSLLDAKNKTGISNSHIGAVCMGKRVSAGGYTWKYKDSELNLIKSKKDRPVINIKKLTKFCSVSEASRIENVSWFKVSNSCKKNNGDWRYLEH